MASPDRPSTVSTVTDVNSPRRYPQLTEAQKARACREVRISLAATAWIQSGHQARDFAYQAEQLDLF